LTTGAQSFVATIFDLMINLKEGRIGFDNIGTIYPPARHVTREDTTVADVPCAMFTPPGASEEDMVVYIHGGGFIYGSIQSHAAMVSHIAGALHRKVLLIDYRLAPEHAFPAGLNDCVAVIEAIGKNVRLGIIGDSAGGNLTIAAQLKLKETGRVVTQYSIVISPWVDLECKNPSYKRNKKLDAVLSREYMVEASTLYSMGQVVSSPLMSPVNSDLRGLAPMLILCGTHEILQDDSEILHKRLQEAGVAAEIRMFEGELHVWPFMDIGSAGSRKALDGMAEFTETQVGK
jgi:epsilon-lactone hydrolase